MKLIELILNFIKKPYIWATIIIVLAMYFGYLTAGEVKGWINQILEQINIDVDLNANN